MSIFSLLFCAAAVAFAPSSASRETRFANPPADSRILQIRHDPPADPEKNIAEVKRLAERGFGGYAGNVAFGSVNSPPWYVENEVSWKSFAAAADYARKVGLTLWLYDENAYPSLSAGDLVLRGHPELEQTGWLVATARAKGGETVRLAVPPGRFLRAVAAKVDATGSLLDGDFVDVSSSVGNDLPPDAPFARSIAKPFDAAGRAPLGLAKSRDEIRTGPFEWTAPVGADWSVYVITEDYIYEGTHPECKGWPTKFRYPNPLSRASTERFLKVNHAVYAQHLGENLGRYFTSTFTDEPSLMGNWWRTMPYFVFSSAPELVSRYRERTGGRNLVSDIPYLVTNSADDNALAARLRLAFWDETSRLYEEAFFKPISSWCRTHGFQSGGHLMGEESFAFHVSHYGNFFRCLKALDVPSIDCLTSLPGNVPYLAALFAGSARELKGADYAMVEVSSLAETTRKDPYYVNEDEIAGTLNRLVWGGINTFTSYYGFSRYADAFTQSVNARLGRTVTLFSRDGHSLADTALFYPARDMMRCYQPQTNVWRDAGMPIRKLQDTFDRAAKSLYEDGRCFLIIDEETVENAEVAGGVLAFRDLRFKAVVLPSVSTLSKKAKDVLLRFKAEGGLVVRSTAETDAAAALRGKIDKQVDVCEGAVEGKSPIRVSSRRTKEGDVFFVMNDSAERFEGKLRFLGNPDDLECWNPSTGTHAPVASTESGLVAVRIPPYRALVFTRPQYSSVSRTVGCVSYGKPALVDFGPQGEGGYPAICVNAVSTPGVRVRLSYATHPDGLGERGDFWHETRATYLGPDVWLPIAPASTDRFDVFAVTNAGIVRAAKAQGLVRYVRIAVETTNATVNLSTVSLENRGIHSEEPVVGSFSCSDDDLTRIWRASVRTCRLAAIPAHARAPFSYLSDGAKRDRLVWSGDLWWAQRNMYVAFASKSPYMAGSIDLLAANQTPAGYVNACPYPESVGPVTTEVYGPFGSDEFAAWFVPVLADHCLHTGDDALLARRYPNVVKLMGYLSSHQDPDGLFRQRAATAKHSEGLQVGGTSLHHRTYMHLLLWRADVDAARLADWNGNEADRIRFTAEAAKMERLIRSRFYDRERRRYVLSLEEPERPAFVANAAALAFGFSTGEEASAVLKSLKRDKHGKFQLMAIRGAFAVREGTKAMELLDAHNWRQVVRDDWPGTHLVSECMDLVHSGWSDEAHPDTAMAGVLTDYLLGVRPASPGYATFVVDPIEVPGVTWAKGRVPTPTGFIDVEWKRVDGKPQIRATAPSFCRRCQ